MIRLINHHRAGIAFSEYLPHTIAGVKYESRQSTSFYMMASTIAVLAYADADALWPWEKI